MTERHDSGRLGPFPALNREQFEGSGTELTAFARQRYARAAREAFGQRGRGVLIVNADLRTSTNSLAYNTMEGDDGSEEARRIRALVESYDPQTQAVLLWRSEAHGMSDPEIINIQELQ
jgi:hypothetical protein